MASRSRTPRVPWPTASPQRRRDRARASGVAGHVRRRRAAPPRIDQAISPSSGHCPKGRTPSASSTARARRRSSGDGRALPRTRRAHGRGVRVPRLTPHVVRYRLAGLEQRPDGRVVARNRVIAKVSRREIATQFHVSGAGRDGARPRPEGDDRGRRGWPSTSRSRTTSPSRPTPGATPTTVRSSSLLPSIAELRDELHARHGYARVPRGRRGRGIGTPAAVAAAFAMGAAYVVTGSINQACVEAGTSPPYARRCSLRPTTPTWRWLPPPTCSRWA